MRWIRLFAKILVSVVVLVILAVFALWFVGRSQVERIVQRRVPVFAAATDSVSIARGRHLAGISCVACHGGGRGETLPLSSPDTAFIANGAFGTLQPANLTPGGELPEYDDGQLARAVREGINHDGKPMVLMPSQAFHGMSDRDLAALIGYMRSQPAVRRETPPRRIGPVLGILLALGQIPSSVQPAVNAPISDVPAGPTAAYGAYLAPLYGCKECHGADLRGIKPGGGPPPGPDIVAVAHQHPYEKFELAVRHGVGSSGQQLSTEMPWAIFARMTDDEVVAIYEYLKTLP
jgi:mono/diheme cytochrome c family protein